MAIKLAQGLTALTLTILILFTSLNLSAFDYNWYQKQFTGQNLYQKFDAQQIQAQTKNLLAYLKNREILKPQYYTTKEILHLRDIKNVVNTLKVTNIILFIALGGLLTIIYSRFGKKPLIKTLFVASISSLIVYLFLSAAIIWQFDNFFVFLHQVSFNNNYWQLDPNVDNLINIFPPQLFLALGKIIIIKAAITTLIIGLITAYLKNKIAST